MAFKFLVRIAQKFIDIRVPKCPMCSSRNPNWSVLSETSRVYFKCKNCSCMLSATWGDVTGKDRSPLPSGPGILKVFSGKKLGTTYMIIDDIGTKQTIKQYRGKEMSVEDLNRLADEV